MSKARVVLCVDLFDIVHFSGNLGSEILSTRFFRSIATVIVTSLVFSQVHVVSAEPSSSESSSSSSSHRSKSSVGSGSSGGSSASKGSNQDDSEKLFKEKVSRGTTKVVDGSDGRIIEYSVNDKDLQGVVRTTTSEDSKMVIDVSAVIEGERATDVFEVTKFRLTGSGPADFYAELVSKATGETVVVSPDSASPQVVVPFVLVFLAVHGYVEAVKKHSKEEIKSEARKYLLTELTENDWNHIRQKKHKWDSVHATTKGHIAELLATAMAEGKHGPYGNPEFSRTAIWTYHYTEKDANGIPVIKSAEIQAIYSVEKESKGRISNGWVRR